MEVVGHHVMLNLLWALKKKSMCSDARDDHANKNEIVLNSTNFFNALKP